MKKPITLLVIVSVAALLAWADWPYNRLASDTHVDQILIEKSVRRLTLLQGGLPVKQYRVALGRNAVGPKEKEGDKKTPEGIYHVLEHKRPSGFHLALRVSYPEARDIARARANGASAGSDIMIHGIKNGLGLLGRMHRWVDWTAGCVAVTNSEIEEIWMLVVDGTPVEIRP
jgi:murein L,D-transpeptidase YafK